VGEDAQKWLESFMLTYADVCWWLVVVLTYAGGADVCLRMLMYSGRRGRGCAEVALFVRG
jgi:hypothetical protein